MLKQYPVSREVDDLFNGYVLPWWKWCVHTNGAPFLDAGEKSGTLRIGDQFWNKKIDPEGEACYGVEVDIPAKWQIPQSPPRLTLQIKCKHSHGQRESDAHIVIEGAIGLSFSKADPKRVTRLWLDVRIICHHLTEWNPGMIAQYAPWLRSALPHELTHRLQLLEETPFPVSDHSHVEMEDLLDLLENFPGTCIRKKG